jgi:4-hydroxy-3-polyprenylbenzoate decarboxylase
VTGASGSTYGLRLLEVLVRAGRTVHLVVSPAAAEVFLHETDRRIDLANFRLRDFLGPVADEFSADLVRHHDHRDFRAGIASGSFPTGGMVVCPCSMGTVAAVAHGLSQNLIHRAADVHLKERRPLILVPRETPLAAIQLRNLATCAEAGAVVLPAMPAFYTRPKSIEDMVDFVVARICDHLGVTHRLAARWGVDCTGREG